MTILFRKFTQADLPQVLDICNEVREYHRELLDGYFTPQDNNDEQKPFLASLTDSKFLAFVAEEDNKIYGILLADVKFCPYLEKTNVTHILNIGVQKSVQGKGIGKFLMSNFYQYCLDNNIYEIKLGVVDKNKSAYAFYEKFGFKVLEQKMHIMVK